MGLSKLQKYIILQCYFANRRIKRTNLIDFYSKTKNLVKDKSRTKIITKSIERLISRGLLIGYGIRTMHKWFIKEISLTLDGKKQAVKLLGEQQKLIFKIKKININHNKEKINFNK